MQLLTCQEAVHYLCPLVLQQAGQVVEHPARCTARSDKDESPSVLQGR